MNISYHNIFLIWFGSRLPNYIYNVINEYKNKNTNYNVNLIYYTPNQIEVLYKYKNITNSIDQILINAIEHIFNNYAYIYNRYSYEISMNSFNIEKIRFLQILSNVFRVLLINAYSGIYVDCDTLPNKSFDEELFENDTFIVNRHTLYNGKNKIIPDNYFFGTKKINVFNKYKYELINLNIPLKNIVETTENWWNNLNYIKAKNLFFQNKKCNFSLSDKFYITHYNDNRWKFKNNKLAVEKTIFDKMLYNLLINIQ